MTQKNNSRTLSAMTLGMFVISLAVGLIVYSVADVSVAMVVWTTALIFGVCLFAISFAYSGTEEGFGPSESAYRRVAGAVLAAAGIIGMLYSLTDISNLILIAVFIIIVAAVGIYTSITNSKKVA